MSQARLHLDRIRKCNKLVYGVANCVAKEGNRKVRLDVIISCGVCSAPIAPLPGPSARDEPGEASPPYESAYMLVADT